MRDVLRGIAATSLLRSRQPRAPLTARLVGSGQHGVLASLGIGAGGLLLLSATAGSTGAGALVLTAVGYGLVYLGLGAAGPNENDILHRRVARTGHRRTHPWRAPPRQRNPPPPRADPGARATGGSFHGAGVARSARRLGGPGEAVWSGHRPGGTLEFHAPQRQE
ncbi:hypothetical protein OG818_22905 [Streptomyces virginiae]|uniref:hypothetical protein n=1 Tax=Streptomyces virginiae TaxID=1961 RepID=UPI0022501CD4|nr:hypothetical protein [Streptomyces virginiae]MCX4718612.1 hypothetical protein [Streptomyces virginiae]